MIPDIEDSLLMAEDDIEEAIHALAESEMAISIQNKSRDHSRHNSELEQSNENLTNEISSKLHEIEELKNALENLKKSEKNSKKIISELRVQLSSESQHHEVELFQEHEQIITLTKTVDDSEITISSLNTLISKNSGKVKSMTF